MKSYLVVSLVLFITASWVFAEPAKAVDEQNTKLQPVELTMLAYIYQRATGKEVVIKDPKEETLILPITLKDKTSEEAVRKYLEEVLKFEGFVIKPSGAKKLELIRSLTDDEIRELNLKAGRDWQGRKYRKGSAQRVKRVPLPQKSPEVREETKNGS